MLDKAPNVLPHRKKHAAGLAWTIPVLGAVLTLFFAASAYAFDFSEWDAMLKKYVAPKTISGIRVHAVDYRQIKQDEQFDRLLDRLKTFKSSRLQTRDDKLSFWINVYNIMAVKMIRDHYPVKSIKDLGGLFRSVWKIPVGFVGGKELTLHEIEHEILRRMGEPRIHAAIVCASVSCPDLREEAYVPARLHFQLDDQMSKFLQRPAKGLRIEREKGRVYLSSIFKWFDEDFESRGGTLSFIADYLAPQDRTILQAQNMKIDYMDYNWNLNEL
ncbi:MAG: DUF547 domain-containing protein [Nitrospinales bacterium]